MVVNFPGGGHGDVDGAGSSSPRCDANVRFGKSLLEEYSLEYSR